MPKTNWEKLISEASPEVRANWERAVHGDKTEKPKADKVSIRVPRQRKIPQTEIEYASILAVEFPLCEIRHEEVSLKLPSGSWYTPDFTVWRDDRMMWVMEIKGQRRLASAARSYEAFKTVIRTFPGVRFRFAEKRSDGAWATKNYNE